MNKKIVSLVLCVVLLLGLNIPYTLANSIDGDHTSSTFQVDEGAAPCTVCGETGSHSASCPTRCSCGENKPATNHLFACELFTCGLCGAYLTQTGGEHYIGCRATLRGTGIARPCDLCGQTDGHSADCASHCSCGEAKPETGHVATCELYTCGLCGAYLNRSGLVHNPGCAANQPVVEEPVVVPCTECGQMESHLNTCSSYACGECGALLNQTGIHLTTCSQYLKDYYHALFHGADNNVGFSGTDVRIAFLDKRQSNITLFSDGVGTKAEDACRTIDMANCPDYLILHTQFGTADGAVSFYAADTLNDDFWDQHLAYHNYVEPKYFSAVVSANGLFATVGGAERIDLFVTPGTATDGFDTVDASALGEYVVADFSYKYCEIENSYVKLTPDANWPEGVDANYCWVKAENITKLSLTPSQPPVPDVEHGEGCGEDCTVEGCTCACHHALLIKTKSATTLQEADALADTLTEEEWNTVTLSVCDFYHAFLATLPSEYTQVPDAPSAPPVESEVYWPTKNFTNAAGFGAPVTGQ